MTIQGVRLGFGDRVLDRVGLVSGGLGLAKNEVVSVVSVYYLSENNSNLFKRTRKPTVLCGFPFLEVIRFPY